MIYSLYSFDRRVTKLCILSYAISLKLSRRQLHHSLATSQQIPALTHQGIRSSHITASPIAD